MRRWYLWGTLFSLLQWDFQPVFQHTLTPRARFIFPLDSSEGYIFMHKKAEIDVLLFCALKDGLEGQGQTKSLTDELLSQENTRHEPHVQLL